MEIKKVFKNYQQFCLLYRRKGTYIAYKKSYLFMSKILKALNIFDTSDFDEKSYDTIITYIKNNRVKKNSKINSHISDMVTAFRYSNIDLPFKVHKLVDDTTHYKSLNDEELKKLFCYLELQPLEESNNLPWITAIYVMLDTGARKNEALNIKTQDVDLSQRLIYLDTTKNKKRVVKFGDLSYDHIKKIYDIKHSYLLWNKLKDQPMTKRSLERFFEKINRNIKLNSGNVHPHRLRKTFATKMLKAGCPITTIQRLLGHSDIKMTMIYLDIDQELIERDYNIYYPY